MTRQKGHFYLFCRVLIDSLNIPNKIDKNVECPILVLYLHFLGTGCMSQRAPCIFTTYIDFQCYYFCKFLVSVPFYFCKLFASKCRLFGTFSAAKCTNRLKIT